MATVSAGKACAARDGHRPLVLRRERGAFVARRARSACELERRRSWSARGAAQRLQPRHVRRSRRTLRAAARSATRARRARRAARVSRARARAASSETQQPLAFLNATPTTSASYSPSVHSVSPDLILYVFVLACARAVRARVTLRGAPARRDRVVYVRNFNVEFAFCPGGLQEL